MVIKSKLYKFKDIPFVVSSKIKSMPDYLEMLETVLSLIKIHRLIKGRIDFYETIALDDYSQGILYGMKQSLKIVDSFLK